MVSPAVDSILPAFARLVRAFSLFLTIPGLIYISKPLPVGDTITFTFSLPEYIKNPASVQHSATRSSFPFISLPYYINNFVLLLESSFENPCTPSGGFDTGVQSTGSANDNTGSSFSVQVNSTDPLW
jgi:hypothetical protein